MDKFNPYYPAVAGMEWPAIREGVEPIDSTRELAVVSPDTDAETIGFVQWPWSGPISGHYRHHVLCNVYDGLDGVVAAQDVQTTFLPISDGGTTGTLQGGAITVQQACADAGDGKFVRLDPTELVDAQFGFGGEFTGRRILDVTVWYQALLTTVGTATPYLRLRTEYAPDATWEKTYGRLRIDTGAYPQVRTCDIGEMGPQTLTALGLAHHLPWLDANLEELSQFQDLYLRFEFDQVGSAGVVDLDYLAIVVTHCTENRVALSGFKMSSFDNHNGARSFTMPPAAVMQFYDTAGAASGFSKTASGDDVVVAIRTSNAPGPWFTDLGLSDGDQPFGNTPLMRWAGGLDALPLVRSYRMPADQLGVISSVPDPVTRLYSIDYSRAASFNGSVDAQSYSDVGLGLVWGDDGDGALLGAPTQIVKLDAAEVYTHARFLARRRGTPPGIAVWLSGSTITPTLDVTLFETMPEYADGFRLVTLAITPTLTGVTTSGLLELAKLPMETGDTANCWEIVGASATAIDYGADTQFQGTYGEDTFQGKWAAPGSLAGADGEDIYLHLVTTVAQVTGLGVTIQTTPIDPPPACDTAPGPACSTSYMPTTANFVRLSWNAVTDSIDIAYEVQRFDCFRNVWETVGTISELTMDDHEARYGVDSTYRVRAVRADGTTGAWSDTITITRPVNDCGVLWFSSNVAPDLNVAYRDLYQDQAIRSYTFLDADEVTFARLLGRDYQVAFRPPELRGDRFTRDLLVHQCPDHPIPSMAAFGPLRRIAEAAIPYVTVADHEGNRWYAALRVPSGNNYQPSHVTIAQVEVTEVSATCTPVSLGFDTDEFFGGGILV